jgi:hypothetical protein
LPSGVAIVNHFTVHLFTIFILLLVTLLNYIRLHFHCYLIDWLLMHLSDILIFQIFFTPLFYFTFHCIHLEIFMDPGYLYTKVNSVYFLESLIGNAGL